MATQEAHPKKLPLPPMNKERHPDLASHPYCHQQGEEDHTLFTSPYRKIKMSSSMFSYQKLKKLPVEDQDEELVLVRRSIIGGGISGGRWGRMRWRWRWRRPRVRLAGLIRRAVRGKTVVVRLAVKKVMRRLKEARPYIGELFAGNYLFMQVNPSATMPYLDKSLLLVSRMHLNHQQHNYAITSKVTSR